MRCEDGHDDAAYVLGALSPIERAAYENHLATCSFCREAVADLAQVPDMLDRLDAEEFERLLDPDLFTHEGARRSADRRPRVGNGQPAVKRSKRLRTRIASTAVAAVLVLGIGGGVVAWGLNPSGTDGPPLGPAIAMTAVENGSPIAATIRITSTPGGSRVEMHCQYSTTGKPYTFRLIAYGPDEQSEQLGSWLAQPGADFLMPAATHFAQGSLSRLELVRYDGKVMLVYEPPR
ncbi:anti-sigma factor family protein [Actinoplanes couchii]|uniref:Anti-sigma factor n=1 Tax=Actinoplanes couchii TaxID=403638 RepID=A0ABQ3XIR9_9ACTN|nr:zf-HC2 domain-containing protein [Actinoplanes couchii]MDR6323916.1 anti-sigma-K factor RskA [Actinoplanes couchii]GID58385.1 anti-sigma factor [Actinoplanes couchii]